MDSFESMRLLIETDILLTIKGDFILTLEDLCYRVIVREMGTVSQVSQGPYFYNLKPGEDVGSNDEIPGFEDIDGISQSDAASEKEDQRIEDGLGNEGCEVGLIAGTQHQQINEQTRTQLDSNFGKGSEQSVHEEVADSINSATRTKTANFSQNGWSDEVIKGYNHLSSLGPTVEVIQATNNEESV